MRTLPYLPGCRSTAARAASWAAVCALAVAGLPAFAQSLSVHAPASVVAGSDINIGTEGSGSATLFVAGPGGAVKRQVQLGQSVTLSSSALYNAGVYVVALSAGSSESSALLTITPQTKPDTLAFLANPSRLPVNQRNGISGTAYVFDAFHNLIETPLPVSFTLSVADGAPQSRTVQSRNGVAWTLMDSATREGNAQFVAHAGGVTSTRIIDQVPGDPCSLTVSATRQGNRIALQTAPIHDCSGNPIPDGTIVTFTESYHGEQSTVDAPVKKDVASALMPDIDGAVISAASGVVAGNQIRWGGR